MMISPLAIIVLLVLCLIAGFVSKLAWEAWKDAH